MVFKLIAITLCMSMSVVSASPQKIITYNIRYDASGDKGPKDWQQRSLKIINFLTKQKASVVAMQEVLDGQLRDLEEGLPQYSYVGVGRDDGLRKGEYSPVFYDKLIWKVDQKQHGTFWLSDTPQKEGSKSWGNQTTRICTWVRLLDKKGKGLYIYNTHWDHKSKQAREESALLILKKIKERKNKNEPYVLLGDLNATTESEAVKSLISDGKLIDLGIEQKKTFNHWKGGLVEGLRIDHIFVSQALHSTGVKVISNGIFPGSDHHPVITTVDLLPAE